MRFRHLFTITAISLLVSCQKENSTVLSDFLLNKVVTTSHDKTSFTNEYVYDNEKKLIKIDNVKFEYDIYKRLVKASMDQVNDSNRRYANNYTALQYDNHNRISKSLFYTDIPDFEVHNHAYAFDDLGRMIADTTFQLKSSKVYRLDKFFWDINDNVIKTEIWNSNSLDELKLGQVEEYVYDNYPNPYRNLLWLTLSTVHYHKSRNNVTGIKHHGSFTQLFKNEYNVEGLLVKTTSWPTANPKLISTYELFYK